MKVDKDKYANWYVTNLLKFVEFLDREHSGWLFFNVYTADGKSEICRFTKNNRPRVKMV